MGTAGSSDKGAKIIGAKHVPVLVCRHAQDLADLGRQKTLFLPRVRDNASFASRQENLSNLRFLVSRKPRTWAPLNGVPSKGVKHWATYLFEKKKIAIPFRKREVLDT